MRVAPLAFVGSFAAFVACGSFEGSDESPTAGDAGANGDSNAPPGDPCSANVLYVSQAAGNDANDGCTQERAIKTITAALALVASKKLELPEIRVCGGEYPEPGVRVTNRVVLRGKYNCNTWMRGKENVTHITNTSYPMEAATVMVTGESLDRAVVIDGFEITAPASGSVISMAMAVKAGAKPLLSDLEIVGGGTNAGPDDPVGSVGLDVRDNGSPEIASCTINGGSGVGTSMVGSIGVFVRAGASIDLHDSQIESGTGKGARGAFGVRLVNAAGARIRTSRISFGGTATGAGIQPALGVYASGGDVEISENKISGGEGSCEGTACGVAAVATDNGAKATVHRNAIYAGDVKASATVTTSTTVGVFFGQGVVGVATSNVIHAGGLQSDTDTQVVGIDIATSTSTKVYGNTVLATGSSSNGSLKNRMGLRVNAPTGAGSGTGNNFIVGNLFVGRALPTDIGIALTTCGEAKLSEVRKNAFVNFPTPFLDVIGGNCQQGMTQPLAYPQITPVSDGFEPYLTNLGTTANGNVMLRPSCSSGCITDFDCNDEASCAQKVFEAWDAPAGGRSTMDSAAGLRLSSLGSCAFNEGDPPFGSVLTQDFFGTVRAAPFSIGHHEQDSCQ